jgi:glutamine amidotransferase
MIGIIDYGLGNIGSIANMLRKAGATAEIVSSPLRLEEYSKLILPGVGAFDLGMANLANAGFLAPLNRIYEAGESWILGICLGAQLMTIGSEEGSLPGLGWVTANTIRFGSKQQRFDRAIPHMGWTELEVTRVNPILDSTEPHRFYFVHSYHFEFVDSSPVIATAEYGYHFPSAFWVNKAIGVQFHPEKSHRYGLALLRKFSLLK